MAELEIDGTHEEQFAVVKATIKQHHTALMGNGQPGIIDFVSSTRGQFRLLIVLVSVVGVIVTLLAALEANRQAHSKFSLTPNSTVTAASAPQHAYNPYGGK